jgi:preprotein translocase SecE subunit
MAMSVAENAPTTIERTPRGAQQVLAIGSLLGALYVLIGLWLVLAGLPLLWDAGLHIHDAIGNEYLSATLLGMVCALAAVGIGYLGYLVMRNQHQPGLRAGIFFAAILIFVALWIGEAIANSSGETGDPAIAMTVGGIVALVILVGAGFFFVQPGWGRFLESVEDQGWFDGTPYKGNQGVRVRRWTVIGVLTVGVCGIITLVMRSSFGRERPDYPNNWLWSIPGTYDAYAVPVMYKVHLLMPVLLGAVLIYFSWRLVNVPMFADFLIATEAEMNKVSWTTRRRLVQDTIVVLVTVFLLTMFLFLVDIMWITILGWGPIGVLQYNPRDQAKQQQDKNQW